MPPAFNLSQDQTLQFDLEKSTQNGIEVNFTSSSVSVCPNSKHPLQALSVLKAPAFQTPTLIGCYLLKSLPAQPVGCFGVHAYLCSAEPAIMAQLFSARQHSRPKTF
jgi:hypothetical protein